LKRRPAERYPPELEKYDKAVAQCFIISFVISIVLTVTYGAIVILVLCPNVEKHVISEAKTFPDPMTPRVDFLNVEYDDKEERAKSVVIDVGQCAGMNLIHFDLTL
jgi:hypothetical protein